MPVRKKKKDKNDKKDRKVAMQRGKGIDVGTVFVKCAEKKGEEILFRSQRNSFFEIEHSDFTKKILDNSRVKYIIKEGKLYVVGNESLDFANMFNRDTRRPLSRGVISPTEKEALPMIELLIKSVVGAPAYKGEIVYYSVPGEPADSDFSIIYHQKILEGFLKTLGYTPKPINEGHAIILSELPDEDFTGIGISFGGGMVNVCFSFMSVPVLKFSVTKAGDWIDQHVAMAIDETASRVSSFKESSLDLTKENNLDKIESALSIYYNHLIEYVIEHIKDALIRERKMPRVDRPIAIVLSGGSSLPTGFRQRFEKISSRIKIPLQLGRVKMASQPLRSVAKGALVAAAADEAKLHGDSNHE